jgi:hypothetical protein
MDSGRERMEGGEFKTEKNANGPKSRNEGKDKVWRSEKSRKGKDRKEKRGNGADKSHKHMNIKRIRYC